jgi:predicted amidophosphoribosyltransferase
MKVSVCPTCALPLARPLPGPVACPNFWCGRDDRGFDVVWAVGAHAGALRRAIAGLKYRAEFWRADALGALLAGWLLDHAPCFEDTDVIVGVPGTPGRDHTQRILAAAAAVSPIGDLWFLDAGHRVLTKRTPTRTMVGTASSAIRRLWAAAELRQSLQVVDAATVRGRRVLVVDDVFTDGSTLREVALALRAAGATAVSGLVLARQPLHDAQGAQGASTGEGHRRW